MDDAAIVLALGLAGVVLLCPIVAIGLILALRKRHRELTRNVDELRDRVAISERWIGELVRRSFTTSQLSSEPDAPPVELPAPASVASPMAPAIGTSTATSIPTAAATANPPASRPPSRPPPSTPAPLHKTAPALDLEKLVGVRLFAWLGGIGLFIGAAFFLEYSIEHDLISPPLRVGIGLIVGAAAIALGDHLRTTAERAGQALAGAGVATLYASLFAARTLYDLIPAWGAFGGMALVTVLAGFIAIRRDAFVLAVIGLVGGFATPWLLSSGENHPYALFSYVALLDAGMLVVSASRGWVSLPALALGGTVVVYAGWANQYLDATGVLLALAVAALLSALFVASDLWRATREPSAGAALRIVSLTALAGPFVAALVTAQAPEFHASLPLLAGYLAALLVGVFFLAARWGTPLILETATVLAVVTLSARLAPDLLTAGRATTLIVSSSIPVLLLGLYVWRTLKPRPDAAALRRATQIALAASWFIVARALPLEARAEPIAPFGLYASAHVAGLVAIALVESSAIGLVVAQAVWLVTLLTLTARYEATRLGEFLPFIFAPMLVFFALPFTTPRARGRLGWIAAASSLVAHYAILYGLARSVWQDATLGAGSLVAGALALGMLSFVRRSADADRSSSVVATLGGVTLLFLSAAVPITLSKQWITVAWALEAASLAWLYLRIGHKGLLVTSALLAVLTSVRLVANPWLWEYHARSGTVVFNWYLYTFGLPAVALCLAAFLLRKDEVAKKYHYPSSLWVAGGVIAFVLLNVEIADAYSTGRTIGFHMGASLGEDMTYSLGWGVFALATLVLGMRFRSSRVRMCAIGVLLLTIGKVFLHDLWHLGALYRVGSMVGLAVALLLVSFLTQRFILRGDRS